MRSNLQSYHDVIYVVSSILTQMFGCTQLAGNYRKLCNPSTKEILEPDVVRIIGEYASSGAVNTSFSNLADAFLEKHVDP
ncbi:hypothetical protein U9M48_008079 [Paspalum notatum var. saurae]|uniref:Uncharacterized protein n=1 Tax=Paspalum notatum var. saurae TaxID=547442 RepID=A0AAQ3WCK8_PASNO